MGDLQNLDRLISEFGNGIIVHVLDNTGKAPVEISLGNLHAKPRYDKAAIDEITGRSDRGADAAGSARSGGGSGGEGPQVAASRPLELFKQLDEGKLPVEDVAVGDVEPLAPTENGNVIGEYDPAKAKPIVVWEDLEGNRHAVTGGKRISMAGASGAETVKAVVIREADGWTEAEARGLGATENLREGRGGIKNVVEAVDSLGADQVAELAGWHQANGSREFASTIRKGLAVAQKGGTELRAALAEGRIDESFAYNAAQVLSMERVGEGWEAAQRELAALVGKVGPEEMDAVLWGLKRRLDAGEINDFAAAIAEERARYNEKKGGKSGQLDSDAILMETEDNDLKTLGEMEAEQGKNGLTQSSQSPQSVEDVSRGDAVTRSEAESSPNAVGRAEVSPRPDKVSVREKIKNFIKGLLPRRDGTVIKYKESDTDTRRLTEEATKAYNAYASKEYKLPTGGVLYFAPDARTVEAYGGDVDAAWGEYALHLVTHRRGNGDNLYRSFDGSSVDKVLPKIEEIIAANQVKVSDGRIVFFMQTVDGGSKSKSRYACLVTEPDANGNLRVDLRYVTGMQERGFLPDKTVTLEEAIRNRTAEGRALHPDHENSVPNNLPRVNAAEAPELAAAQGAGANKAVELRPVAGKPGTFATLSHPKARFTVDGEGKIVYVEGLTPEDFAPGRAEATAALVARIEAYARENGLSIGFKDDAVMEAWRAAREQIKAEAAERVAGEQLKETTKVVISELQKSFPDAQLCTTVEEFNSKGGLRLTDADGRNYGATDPETGKIYLNPEYFGTKVGLETPIHEFGHLGVIECEKVNKPVYDRGVKLASGFLDNPETAGNGAIREIVDFILKDEVYSKQGRRMQAEELVVQLIGKRGAAALKAETNKTVVNKIKAWLVEFWNTFGKALGLKDITPEQAEKMTLEDVADAIRAEMFSGRKYGEGLDRVEFTNGGAHVVTKPVRIRKKLAGRRKAVNEFVNRMGGADDPANTETDLLALWVDNGGRLFDRMPFEVETSYSKGATGVKKTRRAVADEFAESTAFYRDLDPAQRKVFFGSEKLETGPIGEGLKNALEAAGITRFTREDGTVDYDAVIGEFKRQWTNYERGEEVLKERNEWQEERDRAYVEEMERAEQAEYEAVFGKDEGGAALSPEEAAAQDAQIAADIAAGRFSRGGVRFSRAMVNGQETAVANGHPLSKKDAKDPEKVLAVLSALVGKSAAQLGEMKLTRINEKSIDHLVMSDHAQVSRRQGGNEAKKLWRGTVGGMSVIDDIVATSRLGNASGANHQNKNWKKNATFYTAKTRFAIESEGGYEVYPCNLVVVEPGNGERYVYDLTDIGKPTHTAKVKLTTATPLGQTSQEVTATAVSANPTTQSIPNSAAGAQGGKRGPLFSRFAGEKGAANMGVGNADRARSMESAGADREKIWRETGWWKGKDGKWRFELPSAKMKGEKEAEAALRINDRGSSETTLEKLLDAPELFRAYPQLKDTKITLSPEHNDEAGGWYDVRNNEIVLFDTGLKSLKHLPFRERDLRDTYQKVIDSDEYIRQRFENMDALGIEHGTAGEEREYAKKWIERQDRNIRSANETMIRDLVKDRSAYGVFAKIVHEVQHAVQRIEGFARGGSVKEEDYARIAGEVEARNASRREAMTPEERAATPPWETEDVPEARQLLFSRKGNEVPPSALGDGKQRYYEVPFDKAVDKIVANRRKNGKKATAISGDYVFVGETPSALEDIGFVKLPIMMTQHHIETCFFNETRGKQWGIAGHMHGLGSTLKRVPAALKEPVMVIASKSPTGKDTSVVAITSVPTADGDMILPIVINGEPNIDGSRITAHVLTSAHGRKNTWKGLVSEAIETEENGGVGIFYIDKAKASKVFTKLAQANPKLASAGLKYAKKPQGNGTLHSIADADSPVKVQAGIVKSQTATRQFKNWFGGSKVVDANGEPLVVYRRDNETFNAFDVNKTQQNDAGWLGKGFYFYGDRREAESATGYGKNLREFYLKAENPYYITPEEYNRLVEANDPRVSAEFTERLREEGYDSVYWNGDGRKEWMVLEPTQIKSATDNIGTFDPGNNDIRFSRAPEAKLVKTTRVADDAGQGEQTPGAIAASTELMRTTPTPLTQKGTRYVSLPLSDLHALSRYLTGHAMPAEMESGRKLGKAGKASLKHRRLTIAADILGVVDKTDAAAETATLKQHGFFKHENANWCATHSPSEVRQERARSEDALSSRLEALADRRIAGKEPGGNAAGRKVFADQLAKVVMAMPHGQPGVLGAMQTVAGALEKRVRGNDAEADAFIKWMNGGVGSGGVNSPTERKLEMFSAFLIMPKEMESRAKGWYDAIRSTIAADQKLADTFRKMTARSMSEQGYMHLEAEILRMQNAQTEAAIKKLQAEANEPIKAGGKLDQAKETVVLACDDRMGAAVVRVDAAAKVYLAAQKKLMAAAKTPAEKAQIKQQTDLFMGQLAQAKNQAELSRTAWERGRDNADARYLWRMVDLLNEATVRDGLKTQDLSLYLDQMRVIETRGLSGSRGESARQAQLVLDAMRKRLGGDFAKVEAFARKFHAIHEQELLNNPLLEKILGKGTADYWRSQTSYVTTKRTFSPEELAEIEAARRVLAASGAAGGDTVVGQMFKYCGRPEATAKLKGSFADKQEVMSATFEKVAEVQRFLRRSEYVIRLRDMLKLANVEGVHDLPAGKNEFKSNKRYGSISYMENGQKRTLVVPREIADGFERQAMYDTGALKICAAVNNIARQLWIDWNPVYWQRNISRNAGSIEMNMPGMRESIVKRGARFVFPGLAPVTEMAMTHLVRHMPERMSLPLRRLWGEHTALFYAPKAKRMAMWLTDHSEMQRRLWDAQKRGDLGAVQEMMEDQRDMLAALRANMLVGLGAGKAGGTTGFLDESVRTVGKTMQREMQELAAMPKWRRALNAINIFEKNAKQQVFEDIMAKFSAYLHDRAQFGKGNNRTAEESGLMVKKNVSIGEGERKGESAGTVQAIFQPFWNMVEKGVVRNVKAYRERPGETFQKAAWRIAPMLLQGLVGSGAIAAWILKANDGDEEKVKAGPMGDVYNYLRDAQRAYQNCSNYVRNNYHVTPLFTDGYTSVVIGMPLTDEERLLKPIARFVTDAASVASGTKESMDVAGFLSDATGVIAPDFKIAGALPTLLDDTVHALMENPTDYYTGGQKYDKDLYLLRNESWEMRGKFAAAMGKRLWNDFGGRNVLPVDRAGVDNGLGKAPGWVAAMVNDIPLASPILRSSVKVQVGSPRRDAAEITEAEQKRKAYVRLRSNELFEMAKKAKRDISMDVAKYCGLLQKWEKEAGLTPDELAAIEAKYLNSWRAYEGAQYKADGEREKFRAKAEKLGIDAANLWLDFD